MLYMNYFLNIGKISVDSLTFFSSVENDCLIKIIFTVGVLVLIDLQKSGQNYFNHLILNSYIY